MRNVYIDSHNIISPLGISSEENFDALLEGRSGVMVHNRADLGEGESWVSLISKEQEKKIAALLPEKAQLTRFEMLMAASIRQAALYTSVDLASARTIFIFSTTKGSISLLEAYKAGEQREKPELFPSAEAVKRYFKNPNAPVVISNACISGVLAILYAKRLLEAGRYEHAVVCGADTISRFVFSGFRSFQALSTGMCRPFSEDRDGINLGEAAATVILTTDKAKAHTHVMVNGGAISNDANHISGPSKTGNELSDAINKALSLSHITASDIGFISAHGTATLFNDEMEAKAFNRSHLGKTLVNSLKGNFGHTLGAAGVVESVITILSLQRGVVMPTAGFTTAGVSQPVNVCVEPTRLPMQHALKTASGFGGCNAALVFSSIPHT